MKKIRLVAAIVSAMVLSGAAATEVPPGACNLRGEVIQWVADYCMLEMQTDDEIAVSDCIAENHKKVFPTECAAKTHYKKAMCGLVPTTGKSAESIDKCVHDPNFMGRTVQHGGVGS